MATNGHEGPRSWLSRYHHRDDDPPQPQPNGSRMATNGHEGSSRSWPSQSPPNGSRMAMNGHGGPSRRSPSLYHHRHNNPPRPTNRSTWVTAILRLLTLVLAVASAIVMAASSECIPRSGSGAGDVVTFTYTRFRAFVYLVGSSVTGAIVEAVAGYLQLSIYIAAAAKAGKKKTVTEMMEEGGEEEAEKGGMGAAEITLALLDLLVPALLYPALAAAYVTADCYADQIGACARFSTQVGQAKTLSLAACVAVLLSGADKGLPLHFNLPFGL